MTDEKVIPLDVIQKISVSTLRDDWVVLHLNPSTDNGDCIISCVFKTELITRLYQLTQGRITINVDSQIQYRKKNGKTAIMKFVKDESIKRGDRYKSHIVSVPSGEPPTSRKSAFFLKNPSPLDTSLTN